MEHWPLRHLVLRTPRLELRVEDDASVRELIAAVHGSGIGPWAEMPFRVPWTRADPRHLGRGIAQYVWSNRARASPDWWTLQFVVRAEGRVIHCGRQLATAEARLVGADGTLYAHATTTCLVFEARVDRDAAATPSPATATSCAPRRPSSSRRCTRRPSRS